MKGSSRNDGTIKKARRERGWWGRAWGRMSDASVWKRNHENIMTRWRGAKGDISSVSEHKVFPGRDRITSDENPRFVDELKLWFDFLKVWLLERLQIS